MEGGGGLTLLATMALSLVRGGIGGLPLPILVSTVVDDVDVKSSRSSPRTYNTKAASFDYCQNYYHLVGGVT